MSESKSSRVGAAYTYIPLSAPKVRQIDGHPGHYAADFGLGLTVHVTPEEWDAIDTGIRAGIAAYETAEVAS